MRLAHCLLQVTVRPDRCMRFVLLAAMLFAGCAAQPPAPVADRSIPANGDESGFRVVIPGDTLYSIAWEAGHDYKELAAWNDIAAPYRLYPGQRLRLNPPAETRQPSAAEGKKKSVTPKKEPEKEQKKGQKQKKETKKGSARTPANKKTAQLPITKKIPRPSSVRQASADFGPWVWPADGKILNYPSPNATNKGLDIAGTRAQKIRAAAPGRVVYVGDSLRGYGLLIIVKHDEEFLSAYAHNDKVYVKEGDVIKRGDKIADMGSSGADRVKLHFEIRRRGVPVDPLQYLPKK